MGEDLMETSRSRERTCVSVYRTWKETPGQSRRAKKHNVHAHRFVRVPHQLMRLKYQHVHKRRLSMVEMSYDSNISNHLRKGGHVQQEPEFLA